MLYFASMQPCDGRNRSVFGKSNTTPSFALQSQMHHDWNDSEFPIMRSHCKVAAVWSLSSGSAVAHLRDTVSRGYKLLERKPLESFVLFMLCEVKPKVSIQKTTFTTLSNMFVSSEAIIRLYCHPLNRRCRREHQLELKERQHLAFKHLATMSCLRSQSIIMASTQNRTTALCVLFFSSRLSLSLRMERLPGCNTLSN